MERLSDWDLTAAERLGQTEEVKPLACFTRSPCDRTLKIFAE
jgi:hypothetical protein